jgi:hypothetical protein
MGMMLVVTAVGCQEPADPTSPTVARVSAQTPDRYDALWEAVGDVLRSRYFELDRQDRREGVLTTLPDTTAAGFELWRPQPNNPYMWVEANVHTVQRQATVRLRQVEGEGDYEVDVEIERFRYNLEERQITNSAAALRLYSSDAPTTSGRSVSPAESSYWIPLGRDADMEQAVLHSILMRYDQMPPATQPTGPESQPQASRPLSPARQSDLLLN